MPRTFFLSKNSSKNFHIGVFSLLLATVISVAFFSVFIANSLNQTSQTVQTRAAGRCGTNCDNRDLWISDCLNSNGSDKTAQCNNWFNVECTGCNLTDSPRPTNQPGGGDSYQPYDPTVNANNPDIQNFCGANPQDPRCCRINEWKNVNLGTKFPVCAGSQGVGEGSAYRTVRAKNQDTIQKTLDTLLNPSPTRNPNPTQIPSSAPSATPGPNTGNNPLLPDTGISYDPQQVNAARNCLNNVEIYKTVESQTGVPWKMLAGIHFVEGSCGSTQSCVGGRKIGVAEPDVGYNCSQNSEIGKPKPLPGGGCGFTNLLDSCVYGANHLKGKIAGNAPNTIELMAKALGRYNGLGNANCGRVNMPNLPYCPAPYEGYDHIYPFNMYDTIHKTMYLVYCADHTPCNPPKVWTRLGVFAVIQIITQLGY